MWHPFDDEELMIIFEFSRVAMSSDDTLSGISEEMDVSEDALRDLRGKLRRFVDGL